MYSKCRKHPLSLIYTQNIRNYSMFRIDHATAHFALEFHKGYASMALFSRQTPHTHTHTHRRVCILHVWEVSDYRDVKINRTTTRRGVVSSTYIEEEREGARILYISKTRISATMYMRQSITHIVIQCIYTMLFHFFYASSQRSRTRRLHQQ